MDEFVEVGGERVCTVCGKPASAMTLVPTRDGEGRVNGHVWLCEEHEREAQRRFRETVLAMVKEGKPE